MTLKPVLVVEDDTDIRDALVGLLRDEGYPVHEASNGAEGLAFLRHRDRPGLVVLDLMMPVMNGWEFRAAQIAEPSWATIPVVVISADASAPERVAALGVEAFLRKPIDLERLLEIVRAHCG